MWAGLVLAISGIALLRYSWRQYGARMQVIKAAAWGLLLVSIPAFNSGTNADYGTSLAFIAFMGAGLVAIAVAALNNKTPKQTQRNRRTDASMPEPQPFDWVLLLRRLYIILLAGPVAGLIAFALSVQLYGWLQGSDGASQVFWVMLAGPLLWAVFSILATMHNSLKHRSLFSAGLLAVAFLPLV